MNPKAICIAIWLLVLGINAGLNGQEVSMPDTATVHDPAIIQDGEYYYVYCTGNGIPARRSRDLYDWRHQGTVLSQPPQWVRDKIPGVSSLWAPDGIFHNGRFYLCYSGSQFGNQTSTIGLLSNATLDPQSPEYAWVDEGEIIASAGQSVNYNTIDGAFIRDAAGDMWLTFGSYWSGIKLVRLNNDTLKPLDSPPVLHSIASRGGGAIEAPYIVRRGGYYYLFVNFDTCCQGVNSTYRIMVGRSENVTGPYLDRNGVDMMNGGGTHLLGSEGRWIGPGHFSMVTIDGQDYMPYHSYDANYNGRATLRIRPLYWDEQAWPYLGNMLIKGITETTVAHWDFEDGTAKAHFPDRNEGPGSLDLSGNGNHLISYDDFYGPYFSAFGETANGMGLSAAFPGDNGRDGYTSSAYATGIDLNIWSPLRWTIEATVRLDDISGWETFIGHDGPGAAGTNEAPFYFQRANDGSNVFRVVFWTADGERYILPSDFTVEAGRWYHLAATCDGAVAKLWADRLDGNGFLQAGQVELDTTGVGNNNALYPSRTSWTVGRGWFNNANVDHIQGFVDDVRFTGDVLEVTEFLQYQVDLLVLTGADALALSEKGPTSASYQLRLAELPASPVTVTLAANGQVTVEPDEVIFTPDDWITDQSVTVTAVDDTTLEDDPHAGRVLHTLASADSRFDGRGPLVTLSVAENECGAWGFVEQDLNYDCIVDLMDYALTAAGWDGVLLSPVSEITEAWLMTTQPYADGAVHGQMDEYEPIYLQPEMVLNGVDVNVYSHFLEHIYHSTNGGLWGDLVWNRSMEMFPGSLGNWSVEGDELVQSGAGTNIRLTWGDTTWTDYEFTCQAFKTGGAEGFLILTRVDGNEFYWANLGGWGNSRHQFEKGYAGGNWGAVGSSTTGGISTGQWYDVRVRCEGGHLQAWLGGALVLDYTDDNPYTSGKVGLGTWSTQARFRNLRVSSLDGSTVLWEGLPTVEESYAGTTDFWSSYGPGSFSVTGDALNDEFCQKIVAPGSTETGLEQDNFNVQVQGYTGSLWAKGDASVTLVARLVDSTGTMADATLGAPGTGWTEMPFTMTPTRANEDGTLQVAVQGSGTVYIDQVSLMGQDAIDVGGFRPDLLDAVDGLQAPTIRWPGGCYASAYRWKDGIGPQHTRNKYPLNLWDDQDANSYGTDEFLQMCERLGVEPIVVLNLGVLDVTCGAGPIPHPNDMGVYLQEALEWIEYCNGPVDSTWGAVRAANGHPEPYNVKYWELDNETWAAGVNAYIAAVQQFAPAIRAVDPELVLIAVGSGSYDQGWNQAVIDQCAELIDYISIHHYEGADNFANGPTSFEGFIAALGNVIDNSANPDMNIYMSEWNAQSTDWRTGLYAGGLLNAFERQGEHFTLGAPALFLRHLSATGWDNAFINFDHTGWFPAPNYVVMQLWRNNYAPERIGLDTEVTGLNMVATRTADASRVIFKVVNPTSSEMPVRLTLPGTFPLVAAEAQVVAPGSLGARNTLWAPEAVRAEPLAVSRTGQAVRLMLPPLSATVVRLDRQP